MKVNQNEIITYTKKYPKMIYQIIKEAAYMSKTKLEINWTTFEAYNPDKSNAFENMCGMLFNQRFFNGKELFHSNPNNPGVEILPVTDPTSNKKISFQAKYFDNIDYSQIMHSCKNAVSHYAGELDIIYLYCNKNVTTTSKSYMGIVDYLEKNNIKIIPITGQTILEEVMKNDVIAHYYFNQVILSQEVLVEKINVSLATLGPRYNEDFNVYTATESYLNVFLCNESAVDEINNRKNQTIEKLKNAAWWQKDYKKYSLIIWKNIKEIPDITIPTIEVCFEWKDLVVNKCQKEFQEIKAIISTKTALLEKEEDKEKIHSIRDSIIALKSLLALPDNISPNLYEKNLIKNQVLIVHGEAGVGKSQLFSNSAKTLVDDGKQAVLLLGGNYISEQQVSIQTSEILNLGLSFDEMLYKLEVFALKNNCFSYIFIDALNESVYRNIWHTGLPTILQQLSHFPHIKLALSVRNGYEKLVFKDTIDLQLEEGKISKLHHRGFADESVNATKSFLNFYGIPFLPSYYLESEMRNPLFLKLFCKTYSGENYDYFSLFEKLIEKAEHEAIENCGIKDSIPVVEKLLYDIASMFIKNNSRLISQTDLLSLKFWNVYGLDDKKLSFIASLCKSGLLLTYSFGESEYYQLGYNLLDDFICAKAIINQCTNELEIQKYLCDNILEIRKGRVNNYNNIDTCVIVLSIFAEKYNKELYNTISKNITDDSDFADFSKRYLMSFTWRKPTTISKDDFLNFIRSSPVTFEDVFRVLIENASKESHPLNALYLHDILMNKSLSVRDAIWTICINDMANKEERLFQLILHFDEGNTLDGLSRGNTNLLLILFVWLFTSSNRFLRDKVSKAVIEILKVNFDLCLPLLKYFEGVNDPYVLQRLYGVVFGACTKCQDIKYEEYEELAKYVYKNVFLQEKVYPDILLRDYAKLIIEKFVFDYPEKCDFIDIKNITPPYNSDPIPIVKKQEYYSKNTSNYGYNSIDFSMRMNFKDMPGMYGDFGRYVFQSALKYFKNVNLENVYHYSMQFIRDTLGYNDELNQYDNWLKNVYYSRHQTKKTERIGKKYQWITMYNVLARISDQHSLEGWGKESSVYSGTWEPYVRDFDPTLNRNFMNISDAPILNFPNSNFRFLPLETNPTEDNIKNWSNETTPLFSSLSSYLCVKDCDGVEWCALHYNKESENKERNYRDISNGLEKGYQNIWLIADAFFVDKNDFQFINEHFSLHKSDVEELPDADGVYQLFNREYGWSHGWHSMFKDFWVEYELKSDEYRIEKVEYEIPDFENITYGENGNESIPFVKKKIEKKIPINSKFVKIISACSYFLWEEEYDASQDDSTCFYIPCYDLIKSMNLRQREADGFFYSPNNELVCFDHQLIGKEKCFLIRMDYLNDFLEKKNLKLCWKCIGEKQYFLSETEQIRSRWNGMAFEDNGRIHGNMSIIEGNC